MTTKPDFAQKLLNDLRVRKERMAATQSSSRQSSQTSTVTRGNSGQASRGARQMNVLDSTGNTSRRSRGSSRSVDTKESTSQIVLYEGGQSSKQVRDLSMAIAFAFENSGNLSRISGSSSNPLVNFFNRFGRRSSSSRKMETSSLYSRSEAGQSPSVSHIHINEISKGVHKLNQILSGCNNGLNLDRNSIEIGRELLKGAVNLEESLRMLVNLQEASEYANGSQRKSRIKLLEEDEDDEDDHEKRIEQWKLSRPRFSFDRTSGNSRVAQGATRQQQLALPYKNETLEQPISNSKLVSHTRSNSYVQEFGHNKSSSSKSTQEKGRISNVIAKLMGLEEVPLREGSIGGKIDPKGKEWKHGKVSQESTKQNLPLNTEIRIESDLSTNKKLNSTTSTLPRKESKLQNKTEKCREILDGGSRVVNSERNQPRKDLKIQQNHTNLVSGPKSFADNARKQTHKEDKPSKAVDREGKMLVLNADLQKRVPNSKMLKAEDRTSDNIEQEVRSKFAILQEQMPKIPDYSEDMVPKNHEGQQAEHINAPKSKRSTVQKKLPREKSVSGDGRSIKPNEKVPMKDPTNRRYQDSASIIENSQKTIANQESPKIEGQSHNSSKNESEPQIHIEKGSSIPLSSEEKPIEVSAIQKKTVARKVQRKEFPEKLEVLVTRRNVTRNHLTRSTNRPANMLKDLKQQMQNKNFGSKKMEEPSDSEVITTSNASEIIIELVKPEVKLETEDDQTIIADKFHLNNNSESTVSNSIDVSDDLQTEEKSAHKDEEELKQGVQSIAFNRQEQLTEPEKELKEAVIKSQMFLSTAEALFKLNIPVSFLHAGDHENQASGRKLVLDSAYEVMKRKARRHEFMYNPYMKATVNDMKLRTLDDLVRKLCKDLEMLKSYGMNGSDECDVAAGLHKMLNKDIYNEDPDVNCMWDFEWSGMTSIFPEMEDVVKGVERHMLNGLLDEITSDLLIITVSV